MSKKTKQEKIIADLRRRLHAQEEELTTPKLSSKTRLKQEVRIESRSVTDTFAIPTDLIKKDLIKTTILTIVAISLELVVYLVWQ
jgi:hypothetical protein